MPVGHKFTGTVEIFTYDQDGRETIHECGQNAVQYEGYDTLGLIMSGRLSCPINAMYFQFDYNGPGTVRTPTPRTITSATFRALSGDLDFLRLPLGVGATTALDSNYLSNRVTFYGTGAIGDVGAAQGKTFTTGGAVERIALVCAPKWSDATQDHVYSVFSLAAPLTIPASGGIGYRWTIDFTPAS